MVDNKNFKQLNSITEASKKIKNIYIGFIEFKGFNQEMIKN